MALHDPLIGTLLDNRYRVEQRIATGGMSTVYRGTDTRLDRVVALKVMHPQLAGDEGFTARFIREAKAVAKLTHPNVVNVFDQGADGGNVFLAMEYVPGRTLRDLLRDRGALSARAALDVLEPVLAAMTDVSRGLGLAQAIAESEVLEPAQARMLSIGSRAGSTDAVLERLSEACFDDAVARVDRVIDATEPALAAFLTVAVGATLVSVMLPLIGIMGSVG